MPLPHFRGSIPKNYDDYMGPMFFEDYTKEIAARIEPGSVDTALELSCGTGRVTKHLYTRLNAGTRLIASDISADMLAVAKERLSGANVEWMSIDFRNIPFADNSIDLAVCSFGYMFADDKVAAFKEALRVLRPGGNFIISTWDKLELNGASNVFRKTIKKYFGNSLPETYKIPYSMHDADAIRGQLLEAGFSGIKIEVIEKNSVSESARMATLGMVQGGSLYNEIVKRDPAWVEAISTEVERELIEKYGDGPMMAPMSALLIQAIKN